MDSDDDWENVIDKTAELVAGYPATEAGQAATVRLRRRAHRGHEWVRAPLTQARITRRSTAAVPEVYVPEA
ncbi:hypothetical protein AB0O76_06170 [Streptomyces sp. NPDC086554]|uniref:hypothetical protein n=1 Tax=Streptomyces sp. NPDC086554 TaxID=3154864 RepID=UPI00342F3C80